MYFYCSNYHDRTYNPRSLKATVNRVVRYLEKLQKKVKFDAIAFSGTSGAAIAYPVSAIAGYHLINVRREPYKQHHGSKIEASGNRKIYRYIILDDFIASGRTIKLIVRAIKKETIPSSWSRIALEEKPVECVGVVIYSDQGDSSKSIQISKWKKIPVFMV